MEGQPNRQATSTPPASGAASFRGQALGLIETRGYLPLVTAVDGAIKAAQVSLTTSTLVGGGLANATVRGDVGAVRAALDAAQAIIDQLGASGMTHVIARPDSAVWALLAQDGLRVTETPEPANGSGESSSPPALRPEPEVPVARVSPEVPAIKPEPEPPVARSESEVPAVKPESRVPAVRNQDRTMPESETKKGDGPPAPKSPGKTKKPRKTPKK